MGIVEKQKDDLKIYPFRFVFFFFLRWIALHLIASNFFKMEQYEIVIEDHRIHNSITASEIKDKY